MSQVSKTPGNQATPSFGGFLHIAVPALVWIGVFVAVVYVFINNVATSNQRREEEKQAFIQEVSGYVWALTEGEYASYPDDRMYFFNSQPTCTAEEEQTYMCVWPVDSTIMVVDGKDTYIVGPSDPKLQNLQGFWARVDNPSLRLTTVFIKRLQENGH